VSSAAYRHERAIREGVREAVSTASAGPDASMAAAVLRLQRSAGNRRVGSLLGGRMLARNEKSGPGVLVPSTRRTIVIDANVFDELYRGNAEAALRLKQLAANHDVYVSWQSFQESLVNPQQRAGADTARVIIDELKLKIAPPAPQQVLNELTAKNPFGKGTYRATILSPEDLRVAADAKAINGEVWSFDSSFRNGAVQKTLGVKVAEETLGINRVVARQDFGRGLRLLNITRPVPAGQLPPGPDPAPTPVTPPPTPGPANAPEAPATVRAPGGGRLARAVEIGLSLFELSPVDALVLLHQFAGTYRETRRERIRVNLRDGFMLGFCAALVGREWAWVKANLGRKFASNDIGSQVAGVVGVGERARNAALRAGHHVGSNLPRVGAHHFLSYGFGTMAAKDPRLLTDDPRYALTEAEVTGLRGIHGLKLGLTPVMEHIFEEAAESNWLRWLAGSAGTTSKHAGQTARQLFDLISELQGIGPD
jgi:predicted nucleic acid-binding protein